MLVVLVLFVVIAWVFTAQDLLRRQQLSRGGRAVWLVATLVLPLIAIPVYWAVKPLPRRSGPAARRSGTASQTLSDFIPGWSPDRDNACDLADTWARGAHVSPAPSFYAWLRDSGVAEKYPACAAKLVRTLLGGERRVTFAACPEIGALTALLERYVGPAEDVLAIREQLVRLCPGSERRTATMPGVSPAV
jgi:hypothetical protein